ncbi:MAG: T9SS type A sorting domain-containing protein [Cyclobacteriaceae bacterium]
MKVRLFITLLYSLFLATLVNAGTEPSEYGPSPFGTGTISNKIIGKLIDSSVVVSSPSNKGFLASFGGFSYPQPLLVNYTYDIYIPASYDGSEPYGLVTYINSVNNGALRSQWKPVFDEKKMIYIGGDNIGNSISTYIRPAVAMAAALRMQELFNIDTNRIYSSGNSGGSRQAQLLAYIYPDTYKGVLSNCGGNYFKPVQRNYQTKIDTYTHYEFIEYSWNYFPDNYLEYLKSFDQRYVNLTSYSSGGNPGDFREGNIMNIYHNGYELDGLKGKFVETAGSHCATTTEHFRDAVNFIEHPFIERINETFENVSYEETFTTSNITTSATSGITMTHGDNDSSQVKTKNIFLWNDPKGVILETSIKLDPSSYNMNTQFKMSIEANESNLASSTESSRSSGIVPEEIIPEEINLPAISLTINFNAVQPTLILSIDDKEQAVSHTLFSASFSDWNVQDSLRIKYHLWDKELRVELGAHLNAPSVSNNGARLLIDNRSIRVRWQEVIGDFDMSWKDKGLLDLAYLNLETTKLNNTLTASNLTVQNIDLIVAEECKAELVNASCDDNDSNTSGDVYDSNCECKGVITDSRSDLDQFDAANIIASPNPATGDIINLEFLNNSFIGKKTTFSIANTNGERIRSWDQQISGVTTVNISDLSEGQLYFIYIETDKGEFFSKKFLK